jgi:hypothetical protein
MGRDFRMLKIDFENAFNMVERKTFLQEANQHFPEIYNYVSLASFPPYVSLASFYANSTSPL